MNTFTEEKFWNWFFSIMFTLLIIVLIFVIITFEKNSDLCKAKGGLLIDTPNGYSCVKVEKINLKDNK